MASQTLENLGTIEAAARRLVLRPLVTYDKVETIALARRIGTYETSVLPYEDCCSLFVPPHPATAARADRRGAGRGHAGHRAPRRPPWPPGPSASTCRQTDYRLYSAIHGSRREA